MRHIMEPDPNAPPVNVREIPWGEILWAVAAIIFAVVVIAR